VLPLFLSLRNFLGARGFVLLLCGRLHLFLHRVLVRGFRRFVTHDPKRKIHGNRRQPEAGAFLLRQLLPTYLPVNLKDLWPMTPIGQIHSIVEAKNDNILWTVDSMRRV
jgi:hypothetical protein